MAFQEKNVKKKADIMKTFTKLQVLLQFHFKYTIKSIVKIVMQHFNITLRRLTF